MTAQSHPHRLNLRRGELVEVRGVDEILTTLDDRARFEGLPFMPEMLAFAGRQFRVAGRADRTCDRVERSGIRLMTDAVHLEGVRCDGASHDGCDALCLIYWKEAWLKRADGATASAPGGQTSPRNDVREHAAAQRIFEHTRKGQADDGTPIYSCQATEELDYTAPRPADENHSYWVDVKCGNVAWHEAARTWLVERFNRFQASRGGTQYPPLGGTITKTPIETLDLEPGELVQVRSREEIQRTIDAEGKNRGLLFDREMLPYCGGSYRVLKRVTKIIDESNGRMMQMKRDCLILDGVVCKSRYHGLCQRAIYPYWREIWLRRLPKSVGATRPVGEGSFAVFVLTSAFGMVTRRLFGGARPTASAGS